MGVSSENQRIRETVGSCVPHDRAATIVGRPLRDRRDDMVGIDHRAPRVDMVGRPLRDRRVRLGDVFELQMGKTPARANKAYWGGSNNWVSIADIGRSGIVIGETKEKITDKAVTETGIKPIPNDTVIMSFKLTIGKVAITNGEMYSNEAIMAFIPRGVEEFDNHYLYHCFSSKNWTNASNRAVMGQTLNKALLSDATIPLPPLPAQREIAAELDRICAMKKNAEERVEICQQLVKSKFVECFGDVEQNPFGFLVCTVNDVCDSTFWIMPQTPPYLENGPVRYITSKNIRGGHIKFDGCKYISKESYEEVSRNRPIVNGDFLISMIGTLGEVAIVSDEDGDFYGQNMFLLRLDCSKVDSKFMFAYLTTNQYVKNHWAKSKNASTQSYLKSGHITGLKVLLPPLPLQREFAAYVAKVEKMEAVAREMVTTADMLYRAKLQEYFG